MSFKGKGLLITGLFLMILGALFTILGPIVAYYECLTSEHSKCGITGMLLMPFGMVFLVICLCFIIPGTYKRNKFKNGIISKQEARYIPKLKKRIAILEESIKKSLTGFSSSDS
ncbi:MAG: hypothetical protein ACFFCS_13390 [Candidatus Hodarchaeota archaeon]